MGKGQSNTYLIDHNGQTIECDRVTNVLGATKASAGLATWYGREERRGIQDLCRAPSPSTASPFDDIVNTRRLKDILTLPLDDDDDLFASRLRDSKADSGTGIHALIHADATGTKIPADVILTQDDWRRYQMWETFKNAEQIQYVDSEMRVYSSALCVAGTMDLSVMWKNTFWGWDTKTGALRRDAATQMATYWLLRHETLARKSDNLAEVERMHQAYAEGRLPEIPWARLGILHIGDENLEIYEIDPKEAENLARNFLFRLQIYRDDKRLRPFRRLHPQPKLLKNGTIKDPLWLRAS